MTEILLTRAFSRIQTKSDLTCKILMLKIHKLVRFCSIILHIFLVNLHLQNFIHVRLLLWPSGRASD